MLTFWTASKLFLKCFVFFSFCCQVDSRLDSTWDSREKTAAFSFDYCYWSVDPEDPKYASQEMVRDAVLCVCVPILLTNPEMQDTLNLIFFSVPVFFLFCFLILLFVVSRCSRTALSLFVN